MRALAVATCLLVLPQAAAAHEIGTTDVRLLVHDTAAWSIAITTGPQSLLNKLEAESGLPRSRDLDAAALRQRLELLLPRIAAHVDLRFDGMRSAVSLSIARLEMPSDVTRPSFVILAASGRMPPGAVTVAWSYGLSYSTYALVLDRGRSPGTTVWVDGNADTGPLALAASGSATRAAIVAQYLRLGFEHIIPRGLDHILFVLGIFLLTTSLRPILVQVTSFTIAHSLTLGLAMYGVVSLPPRIVEPLIALSIAYVAIENVATSRLTPWRPALVFVFGLLHGMGFAGVLRNLQLPSGEFVPALVSFNVGIELAQLTVIGVAFAVVAVWCRDRPWYRARIVVPASAAIALTGLLWTVQRVAG